MKSEPSSLSAKRKKSSIEFALKPASSNPPKIERMWSITSTKMEENYDCQVTLKVKCFGVPFVSFRYALWELSFGFCG